MTATINSASCRSCREDLSLVMCDLGMSPFANSFQRMDLPVICEESYPLKVRVCSQCLLSQLEQFKAPDSIFGNYAYLSSYSSSWVDHARQYCEMMRDRFGYGPATQVIEIASNDGYLLQHFKKMGLKVFGVEPAENIAKIAWETKGIPSMPKFFGVDAAIDLVESGRSADLLMGNNVLAHVPDINDFVAGLAIALKPLGVITFEFPHLQRLIEYNQFDTIYHEHFSYLSLLTVKKIFLNHRLEIFDVEELDTHGGSLRIFACHQDAFGGAFDLSDRVGDVLSEERRFGMEDMRTYAEFNYKVEETKSKIKKFVNEANVSRKKIVCYGAAAKGVTLINSCGITANQVEYVVDKSPHKQNHFMPGSRIPIFGTERIFETRPDYVLILAWNLKDEIITEMKGVREWGGKFVVPIPELLVLD
ncbi:MAG: class I SAM-dependent methyltransferase [Akkermansiaceae bacterium]|nr:class I SAM-dependent methyltransferase [Akkermansiaceae bacterium]